MEDNGLPSRTSILTAAARAFGNREPDASVRNPDWAAVRLIGPAELALISDHPLSKALDRNFDEALADPDVFVFAWLMLVRTRYIDEQMEKAIRAGASQLVILGAGFDTRAWRFAELLKDVRIIEVDYKATQDYKRRRVEEAFGRAPGNLTYAPIDFARESLGEVLPRHGFDPAAKTYYICEGVSMYVPEEGIRQTLRTIAGQSAPGSAMLIEYLNRTGVEMLRKNPTGMIKNAFDWGEPFVFGVPDGQDEQFFRDCGLQLGDALKVGTPESVKRYATRADGTFYGAHLEKIFQERREAALKAMDEESRKQAAQAAASSGYWLAELNVLSLVPASEHPTPGNPS